jgi:hypothetical protein
LASVNAQSSKFAVSLSKESKDLYDKVKIDFFLSSLLYKIPDDRKQKYDQNVSALRKFITNKAPSFIPILDQINNGFYALMNTRAEIYGKLATNLTWTEQMKALFHGVSLDSRLLDSDYRKRTNSEEIFNYLKERVDWKKMNIGSIEPLVTKLYQEQSPKIVKIINDLKTKAENEKGAKKEAAILLWRFAESLQKELGKIYDDLNTLKMFKNYFSK